MEARVGDEHWEGWVKRDVRRFVVSEGDRDGGRRGLANVSPVLRRDSRCSEQDGVKRIEQHVIEATRPYHPYPVCSQASFC